MYFGGIDAHLRYLSLAVVDQGGSPVLEQTVSTREPERLLGLLATFQPIEVVVETCQFWPWIHDLLLPTGIRFHLAHAKELRAIAGSKRKTDSIDALLLARMLAAGLIPEAHPKTPKQREASRLVRHRAVLVKQRTGLVNRIHGQLHQSRLQLPREKLLRKESRSWLREHAWPRLQPEQRRLIQTHLRLIDTLTPMIRMLDRQIQREGSQDPVVVRLQTIPGIGPFRGLVLATELEPISRFPTEKHLISYAGLAPVTRSSGGKVHHGAIPQGANRWVRGALVSAIPTHIRVAPESRLSQSYLRLKERVGWQTARVATARKLLTIIYAMLQSGTMWRD